MTPRERVKAVLTGNKPDKLPIMVANSNTFICQYYGISVDDFLSDVDLCAQGNISFTKEFNIDYNLCVNGYILYGCGPELGCKWEQVGNDFPGFIKGPLQNTENLSKITVPQKPSGYFSHYLKVTKKINDTIGDHYHLSVSILGPFAIACFLRGIEEALLDPYKDLSFFKKYMPLCVDLSTYFGKCIIDTGIQNPILNEIFVTPQMINPVIYHDHIAPYDIQVQQALGPDKSPNSLAAFMGSKGDTASQIAGRSLFQAVFSGVESPEALDDIMKYRLPGMAFPVTVSGPTLDMKSIEVILERLEQSLDHLINKFNLYPMIMLASVQAESKTKAKQIANKIVKINEFRDNYGLP